MICGLWLVVCGLCSMVGGVWSVVNGLWLVVCGLWSVVCGLWSVVGGTQVFQLFRRHSDNLFQGRLGNALAFFCVPDWDVARTTHKNAAGTED